MQTYEDYYRNLVFPFFHGKVKITVNNNKTRKIDDLVKAIIHEKRKEQHHKIDGNNEHKRFYTGLLGEAALEEYFSIDIIDWSANISKYYNNADLNKIGLNIGVKTAELWKFPIIHKNAIRPELINVKISDNIVVFFGLASKDVLNKYQTDDFILSPSLKSRGTKTAFYGFSELKLITDLKKL